MWVDGVLTPSRTIVKDSRRGTTVTALKIVYSFKSLASKGFPSGYSKSVCVSACPQKTPNLRGCRKRRPTNTPRRYGLADGQLSSLYALPPSFRSFDAASVMMCCSARPDSSSAPSVLPADRVGRKYSTSIHF